MDQTEQRDSREERYNREFCDACGTSPCQWDGKPDGFHADEPVTAISAIFSLPARPRDYRGTDMEVIYAIADIIEQQVLESKPAGVWWNFSSIANRAALKSYSDTDIGRTLRWMTEEQYIITNGRGGCWVNYGRKR